jgi:hypothetical protein
VAQAAKCLKSLRATGELNRCSEKRLPTANLVDDSGVGGAGWGAAGTAEPPSRSSRLIEAVCSRSLACALTPPASGAVGA